MKRFEIFWGWNEPKGVVVFEVIGGKPAALAGHKSAGPDQRDQFSGNQAR